MSRATRSNPALAGTYRRVLLLGGRQIQNLLPPTLRCHPMGLQQRNQLFTWPLRRISPSLPRGRNGIAHRIPDRDRLLVRQGVGYSLLGRRQAPNVCVNQVRKLLVLTADRERSTRGSFHLNRAGQERCNLIRKVNIGNQVDLIDETVPPHNLNHLCVHLVCAYLLCQRQTRKPMSISETGHMNTPNSSANNKHHCPFPLKEKCHDA